MSHETPKSWTVVRIAGEKSWAAAVSGEAISVEDMIDRREDGYEIDMDEGRIDVALVHHWLSTDAFWALGRDRETVERSMAGSLNFGIYDGLGNQVAYARVVTDLATFAWLCDVYVDRAHRGFGLGVWLASAVRDHLAPYRLKRVLLSTLDAHELYEKVGFVPFPDPEKLMILAQEDGAGAM
ncbi:GNAT family N-acetyltransferase [Nocardia arthritidis]|uniref:GNAT family N-acetyltransferase n=2 Tax=Nocardia arthritidis TaxID=228602 RepID=A0A6G9YP53_9NOCA|nr:GNAT family N-acetyltransferase [Nocardia arthritidis]